MRPGENGPGAATDPPTQPAATGDGPASTGALLDRALHYAQLGRFSAAYPLIHEALRADPNNGHALQVLGYCYGQQGRWSAMLEVLDMAARSTPDSAPLHRNRSQALLRLGRASEALAAADLARTLAPDDVRSELVRAEALLGVGGTAAILAAAAATARARQLAPDHVPAYLLEAKVQRRMAEFRRARAAYREALRLAPDDPAALYGLATLDSDRGAAVRAAPNLGGVLQAVPTDPAALAAATRNARRALWLLTDLGCVLLLGVAALVGLVSSEVSGRVVATLGGLAVAAGGTAAVLVLLRWRLSRLAGPTRTLLRANRAKFTFVTAPLRLAALIAAILLIVVAPYPPPWVEVVGALLLAVPFVTLLVRWRDRGVAEIYWLARRCWFRLRRRLG